MSVAANFYEFDTSRQSLANERFGFILFMSFCIHAVLILGVGVTFYERINQPLSLDVTLAQHNSANIPKDVDFLAQANQEGSGSLDELARPSTPFESRFNAEQIQEVVDLQTYEDDTNSDRKVLSTIKSDVRRIRDKDSLETSENQDLQGTSQISLDQTLASLQTQLDIHRQAYAKRPRRYTISSASTRQARDAEYLDSWRRKIEAVGNLNYPQQASAQGIYGQLRLLVAIFPDGSVSEVRILSTSGHTILDNAAVRIVQLAAPFDPFPQAMREQVDLLEIIRTWQFHQGNTFTSN
jgi:protein TonB